MKKEKVYCELDKNVFRVAIFGSSRIKKSDEAYKKIYELGKMLGERDVDIVTGGGPGLMEAANAGHQNGSKSNNARSIGLNIKLPREQKPNKHLDLLKEFSIFSERLNEFMRLSNVVVVAPGGVGTMLEMFYAWQLAQVEHVCKTPIILLGNFWNGLEEWLKKNPLKKKYFSKEEFEILFFSKNTDEAVKIIDGAYESFVRGKNFQK